MKFLVNIAIILIISGGLRATSQIDTLVVSIESMLAELEKRNFDLNAMRQGIESYAGLRKQAGLIPNPEISLEYNLFNPVNNRWLSMDTDTQWALSLMQLFETAGKRSKRIQAAEKVLQSKKIEYNMLRREFQKIIRNSANNLFLLEAQKELLNSGINSLQETVESMDRQFESGNIALSELLRVKSLLFRLLDDRKEIINEINEIQQTLKILLNYNDNNYLKITSPTVTDEFLDEITIDAEAISSVIDELNPYIKYAESILSVSQSELKLAQAEAYPDLKLGVAFDRYGGIGTNYSALQVELDLPLFNRNQGIIQYQKANVEADRLMLQSIRKKILREIQSLIAKFEQTQATHQALSGFLSENMQNLLESIIDNYRKRNISVVEFTDLYETFNDNLIQLFNLKKEMLNYLEIINLHTENYIY